MRDQEREAAMIYLGMTAAPPVRLLRFGRSCIRGMFGRSLEPVDWYSGADNRTMAVSSGPDSIPLSIAPTTMGTGRISAYSVVRSLKLTSLLRRGSKQERALGQRRRCNTDIYGIAVRREHPMRDPRSFLFPFDDP